MYNAAQELIGYAHEPVPCCLRTCTMHSRPFIILSEDSVAFCLIMYRSTQNLYPSFQDTVYPTAPEVVTSFAQASVPFCSGCCTFCSRICYSTCTQAQDAVSVQKSATFCSRCSTFQFQYLFPFASPPFCLRIFASYSRTLSRYSMSTLL
jgi:hypothetical protein